ncbi:MAG: hypothetical protein GY778_00970, partial [bacterium]|nr:hypothetical protein [bacterium]
MFERCVKTLLIVLLVLLAGLTFRLVDLQVIHADVYRQQAADALLLPSRTLPFVRGSILDRTGRKLVSDEPAWDIRIDYGLLAKDPPYIDAWSRRCRKQARYGENLDEPAVEAALQNEIQGMWIRLARFSGELLPELGERVDEIRRRVTAIRRAVARRRGFETAVAEERLAHTVVAG